ncbi:MAG: translation initiation factor IF-2 [Proteobacteria bacterium]|nr:translation initiation factor IF-2 [Pseudomonadota bacterium]
MTKKIRVHELARELQVDWKILRDKGKPFGIDIATHQATISPEEEIKIRAALKGAGVESAKASPVSTPTTGGAGSRVVIRRRKTEVDETSPGINVASDVEPAAPVGPSHWAAGQAGAKLIINEPASPPENIPAIAECSNEAKPVIGKSDANILPPALEVAEAQVVKPEIEIASAPVVEQIPAPPSSDHDSETTTATAAPTPTVLATAAKTQPELPARKRSITPSAGATIVRRASPEEIEAQRLAAEKEASLQANRTSRKEDNRGVRVSGMGLLSRNRPQPGGGGGGVNAGSASPSNTKPSVPAFGAPGGVVSPDMIPDPTAADEWQSRRSSKPTMTREEELEEEQRQSSKLTKQKRANSGLSMRALLEQFDSDGSDEPEDVVIEEVQTPSASNRKRDVRRRKDLKKTQVTMPRARYRVVEVDGAITVNELSHQLSIKAGDVIKKLMTMGVMATMNQELDIDTATLIASEYGFELKNKEVTVADVLLASSPQNEAAFIERPPIVTIMGHVDHGKTSLLDAIRSANVASGEAGGITQHIGAYTVDYKGQKIAFLDTPGHEAFSSMRARGASLTDIVILVVAADDGVMPQTIEAINHAKAANVPIIVAVNKIDKASTSLDRLYAQLAEHGIQSEEWGGENQFVKTSALQRIGIESLLEAIAVQSEVLDLKAPTTGLATGAVVEAHLDKGRGPVATVMVQTGTLEVGNYVVAGMEYGRVRAMIDHLGKKLMSAGPSTPAEVIGLSGVPSAGDRVNAVEDEKTCREIVSLRQEQERRKNSGKSSAASLADLLAKVQNTDRPEVPIIVKADVQGSLEAVCESLAKLASPKVTNRVVHRAVGGITESDISLAVATGAVIIGFNVRAARGLDDEADREGVVVRYFSIIYELVDSVKAIMAGKLPPVVTEQVLGHAEVRQTITVPKVGTIAGSAVLDGKITRQSQLRLVRNSVVIYSGKISSLRRFKDDVREVAQGYECGISIEGYQDVRIGDVIEAYVFEESAPTF